MNHRYPFKKVYDSARTSRSNPRDHEWEQGDPQETHWKCVKCEIVIQFHGRPPAHLHFMRSNGGTIIGCDEMVLEAVMDT